MPKKYTAAEIASWESYLDEGMPYSAVADIVGAQRHTIAKHYPGRGMPMKEKLALGTFVKHNNAKMRKAERKNYVAKPHDPVIDRAAAMYARRAAGRSLDVLE